MYVFCFNNSNTGFNLLTYYTTHTARFLHKIKLNHGSYANSFNNMDGTILFICGSYNLPSVRKWIRDGLSYIFLCYHIKGLRVTASLTGNTRQIIKNTMTRKQCLMHVEARGQVDRELDSRLEGLGFDSQCWSCVEVLGKVCSPHCLGPPRRNRYLVHRSKVGSTVAGCISTHLTRRKVKSEEHATLWMPGL